MEHSLREELRVALATIELLVKENRRLREDLRFYRSLSSASVYRENMLQEEVDR